MYKSKFSKNLYSGQKNAPCMNCNERIIGCHSTCKKYEQFKNESNAIKKHK